jgi:hypothetical protein
MAAVTAEGLCNLAFRVGMHTAPHQLSLDPSKSPTVVTPSTT